MRKLCYEGSKIVPVRFPSPLLERVAAQIAASNPRRRGMPWTLSDFIRAAVEEKLAKMARSASGKRTKAARV